MAQIVQEELGFRDWGLGKVVPCGRKFIWGPSALIWHGSDSAGGIGIWGLGIREGGALRAQFNMGLRRSFRMDMISL